MNKKKIVALVLGAMLTAGVAFNFATTASYREDLGTATQVINSASWSVDMDTNGDANDTWSHTIFPGDVIGEDTITLMNKNNYPVMFTVDLTTTDSGLDEALSLELLKGEATTGVVNPDGTVNILVEGVTDGQESNNVVLTSKVTWNSVSAETDRGYAGKSVSYNYAVTAEASKIVSVTNVQQLTEAINNLQPNTLLDIQEGTYVLPRGTAIFEGQTGWYMPINANNVYIHGNGNVVLTSDVYSQNGDEPSQTFITVFGDNVTIDGVTIRAKNNSDKAINIHGKDFILKNSKILNNEFNDDNEEKWTNWAGKIQFDGQRRSRDVGNPVIENVFIENASISFKWTEKINLTIKDTIIDNTNIVWENWAPISEQVENKKVTFDNFEFIYSKAKYDDATIELIKNKLLNFDGVTITER